MTWSKLEDGIGSHPKILRVGTAGLALYTVGLAYCGKHLTDGFIPEAAVPTLWDFADVKTTARRVAARLVEAGLWEPAPGGYRVHDFLAYNLSRAEVLARRAVRSEAGRLGGLRSGQTRQAHWQANAIANAEALASPLLQHLSNPVLSCPVPEEKRGGTTPPPRVSPSGRGNGNGRRTHPQVPEALALAVAAYAEGYRAQFTRPPEPPDSLDLSALAGLVERQGLDQVVAILPGAMRVGGTARMRKRERWKLVHVVDEWPTLVAMHAKGDLR